MKTSSAKNIIAKRSARTAGWRAQVGSVASAAAISPPRYLPREVLVE